MKRAVGKRLALVAALAILPLGIVSAQTQADSYLQALRKYRAGSYSTAARLFETIEQSPEASPEVLKAHYFRARSLMRLGDWKGASGELTTIYGISPAFYNEWSCDYLLGVCRGHLGKG